jgi:polyhydroxybutyrate depolymerase
MKRRAFVVTLAVAGLLLLVPACQEPEEADIVARPSGGCGIAPPTTPGETSVLSMVVGDLDREYRLHLPAEYDSDTATSLVLAFHWYQGDAEKMERASKLSSHADENDYVVVYPQSTSFENDALGTITSWNDLACNSSPGPEGPTCSPNWSRPSPPECGEPSDCDFCSCHDDLGFIADLLDHLEATLCIDLDRVYATGVSNGGMFVHRLGCNMPDRFAAIAPVGGILMKGFSCAPSPAAPVSVIHLHGSLDRVVPTDGSEGSGNHYFDPLDVVIDKWASEESQGCDSGETPYPTSKDGTRDLECAQRANCSTGAEVVSCSWAGDHMSSLGIGPLFGNTVIWEFFSTNPKPG